MVNNSIAINSLLEISNILCLQETMHKSLDQIEKTICLKGKRLIHIAAKKIKKKGRPSGGLMIIMDETLRYTRSIVKNKYCLIEINKLMLINVYLPYYDGIDTPNMHEFISTVAEIKQLTISGTNRGQKVVITGDFNADFSSPNPNANHLTAELLSPGFIAADTKTYQTLNYTHFQWRTLEDGTIKKIYKWLDHVLVHWSNQLLLKNILIMNCFTNLGDHLPISFVFELLEAPGLATATRKKLTKPPNLNHEDKTTIKNYSSFVEAEIRDLYLESSEKIKLASNFIETQEAATEILSSLKRTLPNAATAATATKKSPVPENKSVRRRKPWWDTELSSLHQRLCQAYLDYRNSQFDPKLKQPHAEARSLFKKYRRYKEREHCNKKLKEVNVLFSSGINGFWRRIKTMNKIKTVVQAPINEVKSAYHELFNVRSKSRLDEAVIKTELDNLLTAYSNHESKQNFKLSKSDFLEAVASLNNGKATGVSGVPNELVKYCQSSLLTELLRTTYEKMIKYASVPLDFTTAIIKPLVKDNSLPSDSINNLRPIAVTDVFAVLYEKIILNEIRKSRTENKKQFGFKSNSSCAHAVFLVLQALKQSIKRKKPLYMVAIDLTKAFDKVYRPLLWLKMLKAGCPPVLVCSLMNYYANSSAIIEIDGERSDRFLLTIGVLQGGPSSPTLFNYNGDGFIEAIESLGHGVWIGSERIDTVMYADDDFILSQQETHMHEQLDAIANYAATNGLEINVNKTKFLTTSPLITRAPCINGIELEKVTQFKYLGVEITIDSKSTAHIKKRSNLAYAASAQLTNTGYTSLWVNAAVKARLLTTFIRPIILYGMENYQLSQNQLNKIKTVEANNLKKLLSLPRYARTTPLYEALRIQPPEDFIKSQKLSFYIRLRSNNYTNSVMNQLSINCFDGCFLDELCDTLNYNRQLSYSLHQLDEEVTRQIHLIESQKIYLKRTYTTESNELVKLLNITSTQIRRAKLAGKLWPTEAA